MGKYFLLFLGMMAVNCSAGQSASVILYSEDGRYFTVFLNDISQCSKPVNGIRIDGLTEEFYHLTLRFEKPALSNESFSMAVKNDKLTTYSIRTNNNGNDVLRFIAEEEQVAVQEKYLQVNFNPGKPTPVTATHSPVPNNISAESEVIVLQPASNDESCEAETPAVNNINSNIELPTNYSGKKGCNSVITTDKFNEFLKSVKMMEDDSKRLIFAEKNINSGCFYAVQIKSLCELFDYEDSRLAIAKTAYPHIYDIDNFNVVEDVFTFSTSVDELNAYIKK